jgi:4-amino-4-deoxy-L-arabinose transferase-like glycosyltransferase
MEKKLSNKKLFYLFFFLILSLPTYYLISHVVYNYPIVFGDEGYHMSIARYIAENKEIPIYLNKLFGTNLSYSSYTYNPFFHYLFAFFYLFGGENLCKFMLIIISFLCSFSIFALVYKFANPETAIFSSIIFSNLQTIILYSTTFYTDMLMNLFFISSFFFFILGKKENNKKYVLYSAISACLAVFTKLYALIYLFFLFIYSIYLLFKKDKFFISTFFVFIFSFLLIVIWIIRNIILYNHPCIPIGINFVENIISSIFKNQKCSISNYKSTYQFSGRTERISTEQDTISFGILNFLRFFLWGNEKLDYIFLFLLFLGIIYSIEILKEESFTYFILSLIIIILIQGIQGNLLTTGLFNRAEDTARILLIYTPIFSFLVSYPISRFFYLDFIKNEYYIFFFIFSFLLLIALIKFSSLDKIEIMKKVKSFSSYFFEACNWVKENLPKNITLLSLWGYRVAYNCERKVGEESDLRLSRNATFIKELAKELGIEYFFIEKFSIDPLNRKFSEMYDLDWVKVLNENFEKVYENGMLINECISNLEILAKYGIGRSNCDGVVIYKIY